MGEAARSYEQLDPAAVRTTIRRLERRIRARFPTRHLADVAAEVELVVDEIVHLSAQVRQRHRVLRAVCRVVIGVLLAFTVLVLVLAVRDAAHSAGSVKAFEWLGVLESAVNDLVFASFGIYFLAYLPNRLQRNAVLRALHRLRSLAHVIDMHQLTKDPERLQPGFQRTSATVDIRLDPNDLASYLDYCSEMLSLVAKSAALCAEESSDSVVLDTVSEIETLTIGMSRKIWQKITVLHTTGLTG